MGEKSRPLPKNLTDVIPRRQIETGDQYRKKYFLLTMRRMQWTINGRLFQMEDMAEDEIVQLGSSEIWEFDNTGGKMMPMMDMASHQISVIFHPFTCLSVLISVPKRIIIRV